MKDFLKQLGQQIVRRAAFAVIGIAVTLAYWTFTGRGGADAVQGIPATVWEGDGGILSVEVETTTASQFRISFSDEKDRSLEAWTPVEAGAHSWALNIPRGAGGYIEFGAEDPKVGDKLSWKITLNGELVEEQSDALETPLEPGYGFFLQSYYDDYSTMEPAEEF